MRMEVVLEQVQDTGRVPQSLVWRQVENCTVFSFGLAGYVLEERSREDEAVLYVRADTILHTN
jgi:hypothetical protein